jgi:hypothetical protein
MMEPKQISELRPGQEFRYEDEGGNLWHGFATLTQDHYRLFPVCRGSRGECVQTYTGMEQEPVFLKPSTMVRPIEGSVEV